VGCVQSGGVQLVDTAEAGKLLSGASAAQRSATGSKLLISQRPRLPSPPVGSTAVPAASAAGPRVAVDIQVTPEQTVTVTLRVIQPSARLPGLRRAGFGSSLGGRQVGGAAVPGAVQAAVTGAAWGAAAAAGAESAAADKKPRKPKKRVSWRSERELESVRWFIKEDPAVKVCKQGPALAWAVFVAFIASSISADAYWYSWLQYRQAALTDFYPRGALSHKMPSVADMSVCATLCSRVLPHPLGMCLGFSAHPLSAACAAACVCSVGS
jgi:hypothetical protein